VLRRNTRHSDRIERVRFGEICMTLGPKTPDGLEFDRSKPTLPLARAIISVKLEEWKHLKP